MPLPQMTPYAQVVPYVTKDGSEIRELMHPAVHANAGQSLAEARIAPGDRTRLHRHHQSAEIYHVTAGMGEMVRGETTFPIQPGDTIAIAPGVPHDVRNPGPEPLVILCACVPPYSHADTELLD